MLAENGLAAKFGEESALRRLLIWSADEADLPGISAGSSAMSSDTIARMASPGWPDDFNALKAGVGCEFCAQPRGVDDDLYGPLVFAGRHSDAYLQRRGFGPGYTVVVHRGDRHVTEPTDLSEEEAAASEKFGAGTRPKAAVPLPLKC